MDFQNQVEELESKDSNDRNPYRQHLARLVGESFPPRSIREAILGLPIPTDYRESCWTVKKALLKGELLRRRIKHL